MSLTIMASVYIASNMVRGRIPGEANTVILGVSAALFAWLMGWLG